MLLFVLLIPFYTKASQNIDFNLECEEKEYKLSELSTCSISIKNYSSGAIKSLSFKTDNQLINVFVPTGNTLDITNNIYQISSENEELLAQKLMTFDVVIDKYDFNLLLTDINFVLVDNSIVNTQDITKNFKIKKNVYLANIVINNKELIDFKFDKYNYNYNIYNNLEIIELKAIAYDGYTILDGFEHKLVYVNNNPIKIKVANEANEIKEYTINLNVVNDNDLLLKDVGISEIPFEFDSYKFEYYLQVPYEINALSFNYKSYNLENTYEIKIAQLVLGDNVIELKSKNSDITYKFHIKRLVENTIVDDSINLKSLKIGETYINLKDKIFSYSISNVENPVVELKTAIVNQDYDVIHTDKQIKIKIYSLTGQSQTYTIDLVDEEVINNPIIDYDKTTNIIIVCIFLALFILIGLLVFIKNKEYKKNF